MRFSTSPLLSAVMLCAASQSAVGAMALMDLDSRQILQLEGNLLFITEPLAEQLNGFPGMADKPVKAGETATEAFVARLAAISDEQWKAFLSKTAADDEQEAARRLAPVAAACTDIACAGIYVSVNPLGDVERIEQDAYSVVNLMARYEFSKQLSAQLNINNVFDEEYFAMFDAYDQMTYGAPRSATLKMTYKF